MTTRLFAGTFALLLLLMGSSRLGAQGMTMDSILPRIGSDLHDQMLAEQLRTLISDYANAKVWGLAIGDFSNDSLPDLALSLYDGNIAKNQVRVYLFENVKGKELAKRFEKPISYIESPIEVGLSIDGSVVTITRKTGDQHWSQDGYSIEYGDVALVDHYETEQDDGPVSKAKSHGIGREVYRNYETLRTRESYFAATSDDAAFKTSYITLPSYQRLREIYPGYGRLATDSTREFIAAGPGFRRDASDLSIRSLQAAYSDDYLYFAIRVRDDYVSGGQPKIEANDRVTLWFDTKYTGDRLNRDRRLLSKEGGTPTFRTERDSLVHGITFALPAHPGRAIQLQYSPSDIKTSLEQEARIKVLAEMKYDTANGVVSGYWMSIRIPFSFLGFETNPARFYETRIGPQRSPEDEQNFGSIEQAGIGDAATLGFTALVYDVDDPTHPNEVTEQATSKFEDGNPSTFGTLVLEPSTLYYGEVHPTYLEHVRSRMVAAGY